MKKYLVKNQKGFALLAALIACLILLAVGMLVINMTTGELFTTTALVGQNKAMIAAESGVTKIINDNLFNMTAGNGYTEDANCGAPNFTAYLWQIIPNSTDTTSQFALCKPKFVKEIVSPGFSLGSGVANEPDDPSGIGKLWHYEARVVGRSTAYKSQTQLDVGVVYGPAPSPPVAVE